MGNNPLGSFLAPHPARLTINFPLSLDLKKIFYHHVTTFSEVQYHQDFARQVIGDSVLFLKSPLVNAGLSSTVFSRSLSTICGRQNHSQI